MCLSIRKPARTSWSVICGFLRVPRLLPSGLHGGDNRPHGTHSPLFQAPCPLHPSPQSISQSFAGPEPKLGRPPVHRRSRRLQVSSLWRGRRPTNIAASRRGRTPVFSLEMVAYKAGLPANRTASTCSEAAAVQARAAEGSGGASPCGGGRTTSSPTHASSVSLDHHRSTCFLLVLETNQSHHIPASAPPR